jgi:hypothetical protein
MSKPPKACRRLVERYPQLGQAWETIGEAGKEGAARRTHLPLGQVGAGHRCLA